MEHAGQDGCSSWSQTMLNTAGGCRQPSGAQLVDNREARVREKGWGEQQAYTETKRKKKYHKNIIFATTKIQGFLLFL